MNYLSRAPTPINGPVPIFRAIHFYGALMCFLDLMSSFYFICGSIMYKAFNVCRLWANGEMMERRDRDTYTYNTKQRRRGSSHCQRGSSIKKGQRRSASLLSFYFTAVKVSNTLETLKDLFWPIDPRVGLKISTRWHKNNVTQIFEILNTAGNPNNSHLDQCKMLIRQQSNSVSVKINFQDIISRDNWPVLGS